ncbi:hypothetical protein D3C87_956520 [compost metagenome]
MVGPTEVLEDVPDGVVDHAEDGDDHVGLDGVEGILEVPRDLGHERQDELLGVDGIEDRVAVLDDPRIELE